MSCRSSTSGLKMLVPESRVVDIINVSSSLDEIPIKLPANRRKLLTKRVNPRRNLFVILSDESSDSSDCFVCSSGDEEPESPVRRLSLPKLSYQTLDARTARSNVKLLRDVSNVCGKLEPVGSEGNRNRKEDSGRCINSKEALAADLRSRLTVPAAKLDSRSDAMDLFNVLIGSKEGETDKNMFVKPASFLKQKRIDAKLRRPGDSRIVYRRTDESGSSDLCCEPPIVTYNTMPVSPTEISQNTKENRSSKKKTTRKTGLSCFSDLKSALTDIELGSVGSKRNFLTSLEEGIDDSACHPMALDYRRSFVKKKEELTAALFAMFNETVFDCQLPEAMSLEWSGRMTSSAGITHCSRKILDGERKFLARITLSKPIVTTAARLRDTLIHEMCHAAVWMIDRTKDGHGPMWKAWTNRAREAHPDLRPINVCHSYSREWKFLWECASCGYTIGRMTKSFNAQRFTCGRCHGIFQLKERDGQKKREANGFAKFVKENYASVKAQHGGNHKEVMLKLSERYQKQKLTRLQTAVAEVAAAGDIDIHASPKS